MSLLRNEKDNFEIEVLYVFGEDGEIHVLSKEVDIDVINKTIEEKEKMDEEELLGAATNIPFNIVVNLKNYTQEDVKKATFTFRRPSFDDMPLLLSSFMNINANGDISPGDVYEFSNRKLKLLFVCGVAQEADGKNIKITPVTLGKIPPVLGSAMSVLMADVLNM